MSSADKKIIPNQLNIIINTSVPGYQKIEYKPYMTIPDISKDDKKIMFNPLVKLNKSYVDKVPENLRKKQFFNKGLFESLLNFTNGTKVQSLLQATRSGFVDNNIKITLDSIFPENSVLHINKNPYVIADVQWSKGNWKIDTKIKKSQLDSSKITDPDLYQTVVKDEIISGENQLRSLPPAIIYGANYTGPKDDTNKSKPPTSSSASGVTPSQPPSTTSKNVIPPAASTALIIKNPPLDEHEDEDEDENFEYEYNEPIKLLTNSDSDESMIETSNNLSNVIEPPTKMKTSIRTTANLRLFFRQPIFYNLINMLYSASSENTKLVIQKSLNENMTLTESNIDELNRQVYLNNVSEIKTIQNSGQGNCFFIAVSDAINYHNYYNQKNRIISGRYGNGVNLYTQLYLRSLVVKYLQSWRELDSYLLNIAPVNADELNDLFIQEITGIQSALRESGRSDEITPDNYVRIANGIFNSRDNFLVKNVERVPFDIDEYIRPFKVIEKGGIPRYIMSDNFWANEIVIYALCSELKLNIIPLESIKTSSRKSSLRVPYANFSPDLNDWNKYLFLYYNQNHYELITFNQKTRIQKANTTRRLNINYPGKNIFKKSKIIFDRNDKISELPPIYILFIIFGSYFSTIKSKENKLNFTFKKEIMFSIQNLINNNLYNKPEYSSYFYPYFKTFFPNSNIRKPTNLIKNIEPVKMKSIEPAEFESIEPVKMKSIEPGEFESIEPVKMKSIEPGEFESIEPIEEPSEIKSSKNKIEPFEVGDPYKGGAYSRYNPYYRPTYYKPQYMAHNMEKKDKDDYSQLAYIITIDMELRPGTSLSPQELQNAKCNGKWNSIRKSWSELTGKPYVIPPVYNNKEETQKLIPVSKNNTKKYIKGGKYNKTVKTYKY